MPKTPIDYSKTIIYKIVCKDLGVKELYVGSTTQFIKRKSEHKACSSSANGKQNKYKVYSFIRDNGGWDNWDMIQIEEFKCNTSNEARARERYWYEQLNANLNMRYPQRDQIERKKEYDETHKEETHQYYLDNQEKILERSRQYKINNKDEVRKYREENKKHTKEYNHAYHEMSKCECECGKRISKFTIEKHKLTKEHIKLVSNKIT